jgi:dihydrofolate reductase
MPLFHAIVAMSENRVIGDKGKIPWHIPEDFRWFKHRTMGGTLIMGRKTFESIGKPLPGRKTVVLSRNATPPGGVESCHDSSKLDAMLSQLPKPYWICGGGEIYLHFLDKCTLLYLTRIKDTVAGDAFFPAFESTFEYDQIIHENNRFSVERWRNKELSGDSILAPESWPFQESPWPGAKS